MSGTALQAFALLQKFNLVEVLFPVSSDSPDLVTAALQSTDRRIAQGKPVTPAFIIAALLWNQYQSQSIALNNAANPEEKPIDIAQTVIKDQQSTIAIPKRHAFFVRDVWRLQARLENRNRRSIYPLLEHRRFRAAYDFLLLRVRTAEVGAALGQWWTEIQALDPDEQQDRIRALTPHRKSRRRRPKSDKP